MTIETFWWWASGDDHRSPPLNIVRYNMGQMKNTVSLFFGFPTHEAFRSYHIDVLYSVVYNVLQREIVEMRNPTLSMLFQTSPVGWIKYKLIHAVTFKDSNLVTSDESIIFNMYICKI